MGRSYKEGLGLGFRVIQETPGPPRMTFGPETRFVAASLPSLPLLPPPYLQRHVVVDVHGPHEHADGGAGLGDLGDSVGCEFLHLDVRLHLHTRSVEGGELRT